MSVATYSPQEMVLMVGVTPITGFSDTDIVTVSLDEPKFVKYISADGSTSRSHNVSNTGKFVFTLNQTSAANAIFTSLLQIDLDSPDGSRVVPVQVLDRNNGTFYNGADCWVMGMAESAYGKEINTREWTIEASEIKWAILGN